MTVYLEFYGLAERPFSTTPDPKFLHLTASHREALAQLIYGVQDDQGFIILTGAIGTGKTTLLHALRRELDEQVAVAFIANSLLPFEGLLEYVLNEFGMRIPGASHVERLVALRDFLTAQHAAGKKVLMIVDEAQNLSAATLEQIRLLSNFETPGAKLLRIALVGQPELRAKLALPELRQLRQRVALQFNIEPLSAEDTREYIHTRLRVAGGSDADLFTERAISRLHRYSGGIPRLVNILCDHCLLMGYAEQKRRIEPDIVEQARGHIDEPPPRRSLPETARHPWSPIRRWALATAAAVIIAGLGVLVLRPEASYLADVARSARDLLMP